MLSTETIERLLNETEDIDVFLELYGANLKAEPFYEYALMQISNRNIKMGEVINRSGLSRSAVYKMLSGERNPSRDTLMQLAFGIGLNVGETNRMLKLASHAHLSVRNKREAIIIYSLNHKFGLVKADQLIESHGFTTLTSTN